jgi:hypothetical protein
MKLKNIASGVLLCTALCFMANVQAQCTDGEYSTFKKYDSYLDANPNMDDDRARSNFAARAGMRPAALKDLYFRCLQRWAAGEPEQVKKVAQEASVRMAAGGETPLTLGHSCKTLGYRYGHTATSTMLGRQPNIGWDFSMPERCKNKSSTEAGITEGTKAGAK